MQKTVSSKHKSRQIILLIQFVIRHCSSRSLLFVVQPNEIQQILIKAQNLIFFLLLGLWCVWCPLDRYRSPQSAIPLSSLTDQSQCRTMCDTPRVPAGKTWTNLNVGGTGRCTKHLGWKINHRKIFMKIIFSIKLHMVWRSEKNLEQHRKFSNKPIWQRHII